MHPAASYDRIIRQTATLAEGVFRMLRVARALVEAERHVDLEGLGDTVGLVCARVLDLPPEHGARMRDRLIELRCEADALREALAARAPTPL